jgi:hypothetical protein
MFVRWQNSKSVASWHRGGKINRCRAVLVESARADGKPKQTYIAFIASYDPKHSDQTSARHYFWKRARERLDRLGNRVSTEDRVKIEVALALRVPPTTPQEVEQTDREAAENTASLKELLSRR